ncbi:MAG: hypothetical protein P8N11_03060 [Gammaproteobacteria bacterium]|nr:hypothetical protein [Gammaproteobacteria bacterium]
MSKLMKITLNFVGVIAVLVGIYASIFGRDWSEWVYAAYDGVTIIESIESIVPYFPFVPFWPLGLVLVGALFIITDNK